MKQQTIADILIAMLSGALISICWDSDGNRLFQAGLVWAGALIGYLITTYLNEGEDE